MKHHNSNILSTQYYIILYSDKGMKILGIVGSSNYWQWKNQFKVANAEFENFKQLAYLSLRKI